MCALFGWIYHSNSLSQKALRKLTSALANAAESRGTDATGIAYNFCGKLHIYKKPRAAHKMHLNFPMEVSALMGHTRMATQGDQKQNFNNHPFFGRCDKRFALAHNGVLYNDKELRQELQLPSTQIETDSYIAVQLIEEHQKLCFDTLKDMAEAVRGSFTFTILDDSNTLWFVKGSSPIYIVYLPELSLYVYGSTKEIVNYGLKCAGLQRMMQVVIEAREGELLRISPCGRLERSSFNFAAERFDYPHYFNMGYESEYLLDYFSSFGYPREDIELLLDFGYSVLEIEEMLMDPMGFRAAVADVRCCLEGEYGDEIESIYAW